VWSCVAYDDASAAHQERDPGSSFRLRGDVSGADGQMDGPSPSPSPAEDACANAASVRLPVRAQPAAGGSRRQARVRCLRCIRRRPGDEGGAPPAQPSTSQGAAGSSGGCGGRLRKGEPELHNVSALSQPVRRLDGLEVPLGADAVQEFLGL
jgi:hypothetical protein